MANEYFQLTHTGEQIDDAINKVKTLENNVSTNSSNIQTNTTTIDTLRKSVDSKNSQIQKNSDDIIECFKRVSAIETTTIGNLEAQIDNQNKDISTIRDQLNNKVEQSAYDATIKLLKEQDEILSNRIDSERENQDTVVGLIRERVGNNETNINSLSTRIDNINDSVGNIEGLTQSIGSLSQTYNEFIAGDFADTQTTANNALSIATNLQTTHQTDIENLQTQFDNIPNIYQTQENFESFLNGSFEPLSEEIYKENGILDEIAALKEQINNLQKQIDELTSLT